MIEVEVKFELKKDNFVRILKERAKFVIEKREEDTYFNSPWKDFKETDEALRIRVDNDGTNITYKGPKLDSKTKSREELRLEVSDPEVAFQIFKNLGFSIAGKVSKKRQIFQLGEFIISLDDVDGLGSFMEIEVQAEPTEFEEKRRKIFELAEEFGFREEDSIRESYLEMVLSKLS